MQTFFVKTLYQITTNNGWFVMGISEWISEKRAILTEEQEKNLFVDIMFDKREATFWEKM